MQHRETLHAIRWLVLRVYVQAFLIAFGTGILIPTLPLFVAELFVAELEEVAFTLSTLAVATVGLGTLLGSVPAGLLQARASERPLLIVGIAASAAPILLLAFTSNYALIIAARLVAGLGSAMWTLSVMSYLLRSVPDRQRGRVMSFFGGINRIGLFLSPALGGALAHAFGFGAAFLAAGIVTAAALAPTFLFVKPRGAAGPAPARPAQPPGIRRMIRVARRQARDLATAGLGQIFASAIRSGRLVILPLYAAFVLDLDAVAVGVVVSASAAIDMTLFPLSGYVMDRFGRKFATVPTFALFGLSMALLPLTQDLTGLIAIALLMGFANGIGSGTMLTLGTDLAPKDSPAEFLGLWRLLGDTGHLGGPLLVGAVADALGLMIAPFFLAGLGFAGALTFGVLVRETLRRPDRPGVSPPARPVAGTSDDARARLGREGASQGRG